MSSDRLLTVAEVGELLHLSKPAVYELLNAGQLASFKIGRARRISATSVQEFINERLAATGGEPLDAA